MRIDPATLAGVDFKSTALTTRPHYLAQVQSAERPMRESNPRPSDFPVRPVSRRRRSCVHPVGFEPTPPRDWGLNPTPFWFIIDERPTRPRILSGRRASGEQLRRDSNPQPPDSKSDTLSIAPRSCLRKEDAAAAPFSPVQRQRKFSAVLGTTSARSVISMRPAGSRWTCREEDLWCRGRFFGGGGFASLWARVCGARRRRYARHW